MEERNNNITWDTVCEEAQKAYEYFVFIRSLVVVDEEVNIHKFELGAALDTFMIPTKHDQATYYDLYRVIMDRPPHNLTTFKMAVYTLLDDNGKYLMNNVPIPRQIMLAKELEAVLNS